MMFSSNTIEKRRERQLVHRAENHADFKKKDGFSFGQKVILRFWLGSRIDTGCKYIRINAAEKKWIIVQSPEIAWAEINDFFIEGLLDHPDTITLPRVAK
jgi:hypothetical protein